jgi:glycosyltransferase involved in cell wall biosynthesis
MITYNHEKYIREAIEGVLMQKTNFNFELIIANDCSPDDTDKVVYEYINNHHFGYKIKYFSHKENIGFLSNFVFASKQCNGKYIAMCEGDDYWIDSLKLQKQVDFLEANHDFSMCFHNTLIKNEYTVYSDWQHKLYNRGMSKNILEFNDLPDGSLAHTTSVVFVKDIVFPLPEWFKDVFVWDMAIQALSAGNGKIKFMNFIGSVYRLNDNGLSNKYFGRFLIGDKIKFYAAINKHFKFKYTKKIDPILGRYYFLIVPFNLYSMEFIDAITNFISGFKRNPKGVFKFTYLILKNVLKIFKRKQNR